MKLLKKGLLATALLVLAACATNPLTGEKEPLSAGEYALIACQGYKYVLATANEADKLGKLDEDQQKSMIDAITIVDGRCSGDAPPPDVIGPAQLAITILADLSGD